MTLLMNTDKSTPLIDEYPLGTTPRGELRSCSSDDEAGTMSEEGGGQSVATVAHSVDFEGGFRLGHRKGGAACLVSEHICIYGLDTGTQIV